MNSNIINNIYLQKQHKSNLCRMYSINNYFGYEKISEKDFENYCKKYDEFIKGLNTYDNDGFSEGRCLTSYIIELLDNKFCFLIPINSYANSRNHIDIDYYKKKMKYIEHYFEFNKNHIWINKKINNKWYKIDSISGVNITNPNIGNNGYILIFDNNNLFSEIEYYIKLLKKNKYCREVLLYNLYYSLKLINLDIDFTENSKFNSNLVILKKIYFNLKIHIKNIRHKQNNSSIIVINNLLNLLEL